MYTMLWKSYNLHILLLWGLIGVCLGAEQNTRSITSESLQSKLTLVNATMCDDIQDFSPVNPAVVFSVSVGKISCFTRFDPVPYQTHIQHRWYYKGRLTTKKKLFLKIPRWSTYSSIQLREVDKGPWRVEIVDPKNRVLDILRFSVTD